MNPINSYIKNPTTKLISNEVLGFIPVDVKKDSYFKKWCDERRCCK